MAQIRVLHILNCLSFGGAEAFLMDVYRNIDRDKVQFDFMLRSAVKNQQEFIDEITSYGGKIYILPEYPNQILDNYRKLESFFKEHSKEYKAVHVHANALIYVKPLKVAKKYKIPCRIIHSHNTRTSKELYKYMHYFNRLFIKQFATDYFACSNLAGEWMFNKDSFNVVNNGINIDRYVFNPSTREATRKEFNVEDKFVVGHVGRFRKQKNHKFIIDIFNEVHKVNKDAVLLLVGVNFDHTENEIRQKVHRLNLDDYVIFAGARNDVPNILQAMDVFLFPSLYEGLPITLIEAQAAGLQCIISDTISNQTVVTDLVKVMSLRTPAKEWADQVVTFFKNTKRQDMSAAIKENGFDIKTTANKLELFYMSLIEESI